MELQPVYCFGSFVLDPLDRRLWRAGLCLPLAPKAFDTLHLLVRNAGRLVTREDFFAQLWPRAVVEPNNIATYVAQLRHALSDGLTGTATSPGIETVPRWGYRFVGDVRQQPRADSATLPTVTSEAKSPFTAVRPVITSAPPRPPNSPQGEPLQAYVSGRYHLGLRTVADLRLALRHFQRAVALDATFAAAYAGLSDTYFLLCSWNVLPSAQAHPLAAAACDKALALRPGLAEGHAARAVVHAWFDWDIAAATADIERAVEGDPQSAPIRHRQSNILQWGEQALLAVDAIRQAIHIDPFSTTYGPVLAYHLLSARRPAQALTEAESQLRLHPQDLRLWTALCLAQLALGDARAACDTADRLRAMPGGDAFWLYDCLVAVYVCAGRREEAMQLLRVAEEATYGERPLQHSLVNLAGMHAALGQLEQALALLQSGVDQRLGEMLLLRGSVELDPLRALPEFAALIDRIRPREPIDPGG